MLVITQSLVRTKANRLVIANTAAAMPIRIKFQLKRPLRYPRAAILSWFTVEPVSEMLHRFAKHRLKLQDDVVDQILGLGVNVVLVDELAEVPFACAESSASCGPVRMSISSMCYVYNTTFALGVPSVLSVVV